jgi:hypothetical protein
MMARRAAPYKLGHYVRSWPSFRFQEQSYLALRRQHVAQQVALSAYRA